MLKTKNNLYLIYDNIEGDSLDRYFKEKLPFEASNFGIRLELFIVRQISSVLVELRKNNLAHLAINSSNIIVQQ
jgi:serine/threonine protein kinase